MEEGQERERERESVCVIVCVCVKVCPSDPIEGPLMMRHTFSFGSFRVGVYR